MLSVIIIGRNEEDQLDDCLNSVLSVCHTETEEFEIIYVDSNSTDQSLEIAKGYPIDIIKINCDEYTTPAAGRDVGFRYSKGDHILFVDSDMRLYHNWINEGIERLKSGSNLAVVTGYYSFEDELDKTTERKKLAGLGLYQRKHLADVGGFDPFLKSHEEPDLGYRLQASGYRIIQIPKTVAHHPQKLSTFSETIRRWRNGFFTGSGQILRKSLTENYSTTTQIKDSYPIWIVFSVLIVSVPLIFTLSVFLIPLIVTILMVFAALSFNYGLKKISVLLSMIPLKMSGILFGFFEYDPDRQYPYESVVEIVKTTCDSIE